MSLGKAILLGALTGMVIGTLAGILLPLEKASDTRYHIKDKNEKYVYPLNSKLNEHMEAQAEMYGGMVHPTKVLVTKGKTTYEKPKDQFRNVASDLQQGSS